jgi:hypothetical protein
MSDIHPGGAGTDAGAESAAAVVSMPPTVQRIRRQLYWQAAFGVLRATLGLLVILLVVRSAASMAALVSAATFAFGAALAVTSIVLARQVTARGRTTRAVIVGLEVAVGVVYGLLMVQAIVALATGGTRVAAAFNVIGLLIAANVLRDAMGDAAREWFDTP